MPSEYTIYLAFPLWCTDILIVDEQLDKILDMKI